MRVAEINTHKGEVDCALVKVRELHSYRLQIVVNWNVYGSAKCRLSFLTDAV